jgi:hypothetical protein
MREKMFAIGDDFWVETGDGERAPALESRALSRVVWGTHPLAGQLHVRPRARARTITVTARAVVWEPLPYDGLPRLPESRHRFRTRARGLEAPRTR